MRKFIIIWLGETISVFAGGLTSFALGVWIYQRTDSVTLLSANILALTLPYLLISPIGGVMADRWNRRMLMIAGDSIAALGSLTVLVLAWSGQMQVWHVIATTALQGIGASIQWPAYNASIPMLVPKDQLGRAGGLSQVGEGLSFLVAPVLAGALYGLPGFGLPGILAIDFIAYFLAVGAVLLVAIPQPAASAERREATTMLDDFRAGLRYIMERPSLLYLMGYFAILNFLAEFTNPLVQPLLLELGTPVQMGRSLSLMAVGMVLGIGIISVWGGPKRRMNGILLPGLVGGVSIALAGLRPSFVLITIAGFGYFLMWPIIEAMNQSLWHAKVRPDFQGRIISTREVVVAAIRPLALVLAGPLADGVFEPLMAVDGPLAGSVGRVIGTGPGRGVALLIVVVGVLTVAFSAGALFVPHLRELDERIPDALPEDEA